jgi:plasmid maintenance system antidote protein VapI
MMEPFSTLIRKAIVESGMTRYAVAVKCGVDQAALSRFVTGQRSLNLSTVDRLVSGLGIEVKLPQKRSDSSVKSTSIG